MLNVHAFATPGFSIKGRDIVGAIETSMGPGLGAQIGYAFSPRYMVFANIDIARLGASGDQTPASPAPSLTFTTVRAGRGHACGLTVEGVAYCWGGLGSGSDGTDFVRTPQKVVGQP